MNSPFAKAEKLKEKRDICEDHVTVDGSYALEAVKEFNFLSACDDR